jgi:AcrR family transcriptional regulator
MEKQISPTRQKILDVASRLFHHQGYNSTGINQIIKEADVAKGSLYHLFPSKEELCIGYLNQRHDYWFSQLNAFTAPKRTAKQKIVAAFDFISDMNERENFRGCSFLNIISEISPTEKEILKVIQRHKQDLRDLFSDILKDYDKDLIDHVYLLFESSIIESQVFKDQWPVERSKQLVSSLLKNKI